MYLWDTLENVSRGSIVTRALKKRIIARRFYAVQNGKNFATCYERRDRLRALGQKTLERFHYSRRGEGETRR